MFVEKCVRLEQVRSNVVGCINCGLHKGRTMPVFGRGSTSPIVVFLGEGPGKDEDERGEPFVGAAGRLLDKMIAAMGLTMDEVYILNVVKCRPPENRKPKPDEIESCAPYLHEQLRILQPKVIVALGGTAYQTMVGDTVGIMKARGKWVDFGAALPRLMPTYHPAYLLRCPHEKAVVWQDLQEVMRWLGRPVAG